MKDVDGSGQSDMARVKLPAVLIGGPPNAGKSVLAYNLTLELRRRRIEHYVLRANPDIEGDWFLAEHQNNVRSISVTVEQYRQWDQRFRDLVCRDLARRRHLPLLVDLGGRPQSDEQCIFEACTHSILLLKESEKDVSQRWCDYVRDNDLTALAELHSQLGGTSAPLVRRPVIKGTITDLQRGMQHIYGPTFEALVERVVELFSAYTREDLENLHLADRQIESVVPPESIIHLRKHLQNLAPYADDERWTPGLLERFLADLSPRAPMAVYGRGPNWLYGTLALYAGTEPFYQFDSRLGWVCAPDLKAGTSTSRSASLLHIEKLYDDGKQYVVEMHPPHNYIDYDMDLPELVFPEPPSGRGVIVSGRLPLWLFTGLARFYARFDVPWIALTDAHNDTAIVIYSRVEDCRVGKELRMPV